MVVNRIPAEDEGLYARRQWTPRGRGGRTTVGSELSFEKNAASLLESDESGNWAKENVLNPFINGTGVIQLYNNFVSEKKEPLKVAQAKMLSRDWAVQAVSSAAGAILPYALAGKAAGFALESTGNKLGLQGMAGRFFASETTAQVIGAGLYDFAKSPHKGETRLGNAAGSMVGFGLFSVGNRLVDYKLANSATGWNVLGKIGAGAVGGLGSYETSTRVSEQLGEKTDTSWEARTNAMVNGAFLNVAMPLVQKGTTRVIDELVHAQSWGKGIPIARQLDYLGFKDPELLKLAKENPLARVKMVEDAPQGSRADTHTNTVDFVKSEGPGKLAHELKHLRLAKQGEPAYRHLAQILEGNPDKIKLRNAEAEFIMLRGTMESQARQVEKQLIARRNGTEVSGPDSPLNIAFEKASNGKTYLDNWGSEWAQFRSDRNFRPRYEYSPGRGDGTAGGSSLPIKAEARTSFAIPGQIKKESIKPGSPDHLGATVSDKGINFAVESTYATKMELLIYKNPNDKQPAQVIPMQKTGETWHAFVEGLPEGTAYHYRADGPYNPADGHFFNPKKALLDPYAKQVSHSELPVNDHVLAFDPKAADPINTPSKLDSAEHIPKAIAVRTGDKTFDWKGDKPLNIPWSESVIMEANLRGYSAGDPALGSKAGTYVGTLEKLMHAKQQLGAKFTAVEFTPLMQGDRGPWPPKNPLTGEQLRDSWNYNQTAYMSPAGDLAHKPGNQVNELKTLVRDVHQKLGSEVILDIVFNHTRESDVKGPTFSFRGLDNKNYYMLMPNRPELYRDLTGCGNTLNVNNPRVQKLILDTLRYWVTDYHVDGFRFDLASVFKVEANGNESFKPPIIKAIESDPILKNTKLIAEPWSMTQYHLGNFSDVRWGEWNGKFRDTVRRFVKGDTGQLADLATRIAGSDDMFDRSQGRNSINFITAHDGFTLYDLVSYNNKRNHANGENNRDGSNDNFSWNHGHEGSVKDAPIPQNQKAAIEQLRTQQMKNMMSILFLSQGVPMYLAGDDMRRTVDGNNNAWNGDKQNQVDWKLAQQNPDMLRFTSKMIELRQRAEIGKLQPKDITWHGIEPFKPEHFDQNRFIAWEYKPASEAGKPLYMAFNAYWEPITVKLPSGGWQKLVDTTQPMGRDIVDPGQGARVEHSYTIQPRSGIVLQSDNK